MNRGYAGFYKSYYLRSSYEYAYAKFLDYHSISWGYEDKVFNLGYKFYKPDFFFYNDNGDIIKIVEIKSRDIAAKEKALEALKIIETTYDINCVLISYEELLEMYKLVPFSLTSTITEWIESKNTTISKASYGKYNGHFNRQHNEQTKKIIGQHTKRLWESNSPAKARMIEGLRKSGLSQKGKQKKPREQRICKSCGSKFEVIVSSSKWFCTQSCAGSSNIQVATQTYVEKRAKIHQEIKQTVIKWAIDNQEIITATPFNQIKLTLQPLIESIYQEFGVKDFRVISKSIFGEDRGRKELLRFMKKVCNENVC